MNDEFLKGFQDSTLDVIEIGYEFAEKLIKEFSEMETSSYSKGYLKGYEMRKERERKGE